MGTYLVMKNNFRRSLHHKVLFIATFLIPIVLCILIGMVKFGKTTLRVGILEADTGVTEMAEKDELYDLLDQSEGIKYAKASEATLDTDLMTGKFNVILDYRGSNSIVNYRLLSFQKDEKKTLINNIFKNAFVNKESIQLTGLKKEGLTKTERMMAVLLSMFMMFSTIYSSAMIRDRQSDIIQRYKFANNDSRGYVYGYIVYSFLIALLQVVICMVVLMLIQKDFTPGYLEGILMSVIIAGISTIFSVLICLGSKSEVQANITASALVAIMSLLGGTFVAVEAMPGLLRILSFASPIRWVVELVRFL